MHQYVRKHHLTEAAEGQLVDPDTDSGTRIGADRGLALMSGASVAGRASVTGSAP